MLQFLTGASRAATGWVAKRGRHLPAVFNCKRYSSEFSNDVTGYGADLQEISKEYSAPHLWYPGARRKKRKIIAHVGPTNSGKTHTAVQKLITNPDLQGLYCSPLRLLAWETFERLNANGAKTNAAMQCTRPKLCKLECRICKGGIIILPNANNPRFIIS